MNKVNRYFMIIAALSIVIFFQLFAMNYLTDQHKESYDKYHTEQVKKLPAKLKKVINSETQIAIYDQTSHKTIVLTSPTQTDAIQINDLMPLNFIANQALKNKKVSYDQMNALNTSHQNVDYQSFIVQNKFKPLNSLFATLDMPQSMVSDSDALVDHDTNVSTASDQMTLLKNVYFKSSHFNKQQQKQIQDNYQKLSTIDNQNNTLLNKNAPYNTQVWNSITKNESKWVVNTAAHIKTQHANYVVVIMTNQDKARNQSIQYVTKLSSIINSNLTNNSKQ